ncbi:MAG: FkbM family methyltransferase [Chloroflexota bacterium]
MDVPCTLLDQYTKALGINRLDIVKIDVEGAEMLVLKGAIYLLSEYRPVIFCEVSNRLSEPLGNSSHDVKPLIGGLVYKFYRYQGGDLSSVTLDECHDCENLILLRDERFRDFPHLGN